jgi:PAS domain-containing protein
MPIYSSQQVSLSKEYINLIDIFEQIQEGFVISNKNFEFLFFNQAYLNLYGDNISPNFL